MSAPTPCRILEWDSEFFGCRIASLAQPGLTEQRVTTAVDWCRSNRVECLYVLSDAEDTVGSRVLEDAGARVMDVRMTFERLFDPVHQHTRPADSSAPTMAHATRSAVRASSAVDIPPLRALAETSHKSSRFWADEHFTRERCAELYATWIEKSCRGWADRVFVADSDGRPVGYLSCHLRDSGRGEIGIVAVAPSAQGHGFGGDLLDTALGWFADRKVERVTVVTQGRNIAAQRLYQSRGFVTAKVQLWHHLWFVPEAVRS